jgi:hypothetical protein
MDKEFYLGFPIEDLEEDMLSESWEERGLRSEEDKLDLITEISKISISPGEALVIRVPDTTSRREVEALQLQLMNILGTNRIVVLVGDIALDKVEFEMPKGRHPLY